MPKTFRDIAGREWLVSVTVGDVRRVRDAIGVDLYGLVDKEFAGLRNLLSDPVKLVDVIYVLCRKEANERSVTDEQFGEAMAGDSIEQAVDAFLEALTDFFPNPRVRGGLRNLMTTAKKVTNRAMEIAETEMGEKIAALDVEAEARKLISSFGNARAS